MPGSERGSPTVSASQSELLTVQFYNWETRGRGWDVWGRPVDLEPAFRPFFYHIVSPQGPITDDARKPTLLGGLVEKLRNRMAGDAAMRAAEIPQEEEPEPGAAEGGTIAELQLSIPPTLKVTRDMAEQFLLSLSRASAPLAFEVVGDAHGITIQLACHEAAHSQVRQQLKGFFPEPVLGERSGFLAERWNVAGGETVVVDFGLDREFMLPLRPVKGFDVDPLIGIVSALSELQEHEVGLLQVLFQPAAQPWTESILRAVSDWDGGSFFVDTPQLVPFAREKVSRPLFAVVVRAAAVSHDSRRAWQIVQAIGGSLRQLSSPVGNELAPLENEGYADPEHRDDVLLRRSQRSGMLLNSEELVSLVHVPSASVRVPKLAREVKKTMGAPALSTGTGVVLGLNQHAGKTTPVTLRPDQRVRHTYIIGASGTGKSTLLLNLILQDIKNGEGVGVLDPHGDLIDQILGHVPEERFDDVVLLDPADEEFPVGCNMLSAHSNVEKNLLASDLVAVFRRLSTSWGDQMTSVLGNAILAFLESDRGGTLADLRRFLVAADFRKSFLKSVKDSEVIYYWEKEYPLLGGKPQAPLLTRLDTFLRPRLIRYMVAQKENRLDLGTIMNKGKILLVKLAQGAIGEENAYLLGTLLVSKFQQIAMSRQEFQESDRKPFYLYIDEFHNFVTPTMASILSGARKYRLGLVLAHQDLRQLWSRDADVGSAVLSNPYVRVCFRVGEQDAEKLQSGFSHFDAKDLQNLGIGEAICRIERAEYDFNLKTSPLPPVEVAIACERRDKIVALSRAKFAIPREQVDVLLRRETIAVAPPPAEPVREKRVPPPVPPRQEPAQAEEFSAPPPRPSAPSPPSPGRGGAEHKRLQYFIKQCGESRGYRATIEKQILDGLASVDVALEKGDRTIACEVSITSTPEQELGNVQKCIQAGFEYVLVVSSQSKTLARAKKSISAGLREEEMKRVRFFTHAEVLSFLDERDAQAAGSERTVRGIKVKTRFRPLSDEESASRRGGLTRTLVDAFQRLKSKKPDHGNGGQATTGPDSKN